MTEYVGMASGTKAGVIAGASGAILAAVAAVNHEEVLAWCGVAIAGLSIVTSGGTAAFHKFKAAIREENLQDANAVLAMAKVIADAHSEFEQRVARMDQRLIEVELRIARAAEKTGLDPAGKHD